MLGVFTIVTTLCHVSATGYPAGSAEALPNLGYGLSGSAAVYPAVNYPPPINPPSLSYRTNVGYSNDNAQPSHGYSKQTSGNGESEIESYPPSNNAVDNYGKYQPQVNRQPSGHYGKSGPDFSDPCFARYPNCMIVNAQPYERRSSVSVQECKTFCSKNSYQQQSQTTTSAYHEYDGGTVYQCRSFVYDKHSRICDLYSHLGNAHSSQLMQYYGRDYFEPTGFGGVCPNQVIVFPVTQPVPTDFVCPVSQIARYVKMTGVKYSSSNPPISIDGVTEDQCLYACDKNQVIDRQALCKSFNYNIATKQCEIFRDVIADSITRGQNLQPSQNVDYYEKVCFDSSTAASCPRVFERQQQKILVGFAEVVTGAGSMSECLEKCLNSQVLFQFRCQSGQFFYDSGTETNCVLNMETSRTKSNLFIDDPNDQVDYFELNCLRSTRLASSRNIFSRRTGASRQLSDKSLEDNKLAVSDEDDFEGSGETTVFNEWTHWTPCDRRSDGRRVRYRRCGKSNIKECPFESEHCRRQTLQSSAQFSIQKDVEEAPISLAKTSMCPLDVCCPTLGGCRIGLLKSSSDGQLRWCSDPCKKKSQ